jgi:hypothetical protein
MEKILMEIISKNILIQQALKTQNAWLIKFELKKNVNFTPVRYNQLIVPELVKYYPDNILNEAEIRVLYQEDFVIKKFEKYAEMMEVWKFVPNMEKTLESKEIKDHFFIYCSVIDKEGMEIKNNKKS